MSHAASLSPAFTALLSDFDARQAAHRGGAFALAAHLGARRPSARVLDDDERFAQWSARAAWAKSRAGRLGLRHPEVCAAVAEADLYSGQPQPPRPWPAPLPSWAFPALDAVTGAAL